MRLGKTTVEKSAGTPDWTSSYHRLLWVNHFAVTPNEGGGTRHFELSRELLKLGWNVTIAASDFNFQMRDYTRREGAGSRRVFEEEIGGVGFDWLWSAPYSTNDWRRGWNWLTFAWSLLTHYRRANRFDVVVGSSPHLFAALAASRVARKLQVPYVLELRDLWPESLVAAGGKKGAFYYILKVIARYLYSHADRIIVFTEGSAAYLEKSGVDRRKIVVIPNGVDAHLPIDLERPQRTDDCVRIFYTGAHGPANGLNVVLEAAELLRQLPQVRFVLVGDGPSKAELVATATERKLSNVEFRDPIPKGAIPTTLLGADAGLMVLRNSPLFSFAVSPNKLLDYMAASLPVLCNVRGEVAAILADSGAGIQARDSSGEALADAVRLLLSRPARERSALGEAGRDWVTRERSPGVLGTRLNDLLRGLQQS